MPYNKTFLIFAAYIPSKSWFRTADLISNLHYILGIITATRRRFLKGENIRKNNNKLNMDMSTFVWKRKINPIF
jgi:hypothetical protein